MKTWPLRAKLVALTTLLLALTLALSAVITSAILTRYLVGQVDDQLIRTASNPALLQATAQEMDNNHNNQPSDYFILIRDNANTANAQDSELVWAPTRARYGAPEIPLSLNPAPNPVRGRPGEPSHPVTVPNADPANPTQWRVVSVNLPNHVTVYLALPLGAVQQATAMLTRTLLLTGLGVIGLGSLLAWWLVRRSLAPLHQIEKTAAAIVQNNNLATRVPVTAPATTEVGSLQVSLNAMLNQIQQSFSAEQAANQRMRQFVSDASHELRTPLAVMRGYTELYRMGGVPVDAVPQTFGRIEGASQQMGGLVEELLTLARLDEGRDLQLGPVNLTRIVQNAAADLHALDPARAITVHCSPPDSDVVITGDEVRIRQALTNLVGNVARHTPAGTPCEIELTCDGATATVAVIDHGPGVSSDALQHIFERFYRSDASRNRELGGSGLGLAIVAAVAAVHHGSVAATTTPGGGLTVTLGLPVA